MIGWVTRWLGRHLIGVHRRRGAVSRAAGGRIGRLDLRLAGHAAWLEATARWATWQQVTRGLRPALPWEHYLRRHEAKPQQLRLTEARRMFLRQPAIAANARPQRHPRPTAPARP